MMHASHKYFFMKILYRYGFKKRQTVI